MPKNERRIGKYEHENGGNVMLIKVDTEKSNKIDVAAMLERFDKEYEFLYENRDNVAGYDEAVTAFDQHLKNDSFKKILKEFIIYRGDIISSDREAAAYMFMCDVLELI